MKHSPDLRKVIFAANRRHLMSELVAILPRVASQELRAEWTKFVGMLPRQFGQRLAHEFMSKDRQDTVAPQMSMLGVEYDPYDYDSRDFLPVFCGEIEVSCSKMYRTTPFTAPWEELFVPRPGRFDVEDVHAALEVLSNEFGIQPRVPDLLLPTDIEMSSGVASNLEAIADFITADPERENVFCDVATQWLVLWNVKTMERSYAASRQDPHPPVPIELILDNARPTALWLTWAEYVGTNWGARLNWSEYPWPWDVD